MMTGLSKICMYHRPYICRYWEKFSTWHNRWMFPLEYISSSVCARSVSVRMKYVLMWFISVEPSLLWNPWHIIVLKTAIEKYSAIKMIQARVVSVLLSHELNYMLYWHHRDIKPIQSCTVYPKKYAHGFCFAVLCCDYTLTDFPISIRLTSLALWQSNDCPSASKATLMNMDKYFMWIHNERLHYHNKAKHNKTVCKFFGIYCTKPLPYGTEWTTRDVAANGRFLGLLITEAAAQILLWLLQKRCDINGGYSGSELWWPHDLDTLFVLLCLLRRIHWSPVKKSQWCWTFFVVSLSNTAEKTVGLLGKLKRHVTHVKSQQPWSRQLDIPRAIC